MEKLTINDDGLVTKVESVDKVTKKLDELEDELGDKKFSDIPVFCEDLRSLIKITRAVVALRKEALASETWYTFVPCDHGEDVDEALKALGDL